MSLSPRVGTSRRASLIKPRTFLGDGAVERTRRTDSEHAALGVPLSEWLKVRRREQNIVTRVEAIGEDVERRDPELAAIAAQLKQKHAAEAQKKKLTYGQMLWGRLRMNDKLRNHLRQFTQRQTKVEPLATTGLSVAVERGSRRPSLQETPEEDGEAGAPRARQRPPQPGRKGRVGVVVAGARAGQRRRRARQRRRRQAARSARAAGRHPTEPLEPHWSPAPPAVYGPPSWMRQKVWSFDWVPTEHKLGALPSFYRQAPRLRADDLYRCQVRSARSERAGRRSKARQVAQHAA
ncbi:hypothetical protein FJT64_003057 [Amphibalanus amphitrite]|uniref:Uncharacterized protein n=1 Tax=Amphibalanus amphitrite TaxID=1232801 RepID=A0A6A4W3K5_AMPAM|nr:hypothetical protein FJT64_003057 [Amphibalanus amphitrite]